MKKIIVVNLPSNGNPSKIQSKWGKCGIFIHYVDDCPYTSSGVSVGCWH